MSANVKIGNNTIQNATAIRLESADTAGEYVTFSEGGGAQPTLFAPVVTGGVNSISWANNEANGDFEVTITADVDGTPVTSPLTITEQMDGSTLTIIASATDFDSAIVEIQLSYISGGTSVFAGNRSTPVILKRTANPGEVVSWGYNGSEIAGNTVVYTLPLGNNTITLALQGIALTTKNALRSELYENLFWFQDANNPDYLVKLNGTLTVYNVTQDTSVVYTYSNSTGPSNTTRLNINEGDVLTMLVNADMIPIA